MAIRNSLLGGTDFSDGETLYGTTDLNDTNDALVGGGLLGEVKMFALSISGAISKANLIAKGWAICDGTTPATQGISSPTIATTPDLQDNFIRMSNDETSGSTGGSDTHNHKWLNRVAGTSNTVKTEGTSGNGDTNGFNSAGAAQDFEATRLEANSYYTDNASTLPAYTEMAFFIKVKII